MSYEGYTQYLCKNGHYDERDCYFEDLERCVLCNEKIVWTNMVDITNGSFDDEGRRIDGYVMLELNKRECCDKCGSCLEQTFKIPTRKRK